MYSIIYIYIYNPYPLILGFTFKNVSYILGRSPPAKTLGILYIYIVDEQYHLAPSGTLASASTAHLSVRLNLASMRPWDRG